MKTVLVNLLFGTMLLMATSSCKKVTIPDVANNYPTDFRGIFEQFWYKMNKNYVYWDVDTTNWDEVYAKYAPLFRKLNIENDADVRKSVTLFKELTKTLIDGHYEIQFIDPRISTSLVNPAMERKLIAPNYHAPYSYDKLVKKYLDSGYVYGYDNTSNNDQSVYAISGKINGNVLYFHCDYFGLKRSYYASVANDVRPVLQYFFSQLESSKLRGVIIDLRGTPGGDIIDLNFFVGRLINKDMLFGYTRNKNGDGRLDYSPWMKSILLTSSTNNIAYPIVVLGDNFSGSLSETVIMIVSTLPGCHFIGETTWGATGPLSDSAIFNSGSFTVGDFLSVKTSSVEFRNVNKKSFEGCGLLPDIAVSFNLQKINAGVDEQLEVAVTTLMH